MTIQVTELLKLISKATQLDLIVEVREDKDWGDYVVRIYEMFRPENFDEEIVITQKGENDWNKGTHCFYAMMGLLDEKLEKNDKRKSKHKNAKNFLLV